MDNEEYKNKLIAILCYWCGNPLPLSNRSKVSVCPTCYRRLLNAGISDKEIFQEDSSSNAD